MLKWGCGNLFLCPWLSALRIWSSFTKCSCENSLFFFSGFLKFSCFPLCASLGGTVICSCTSRVLLYSVFPNHADLLRIAIFPRLSQFFYIKYDKIYSPYDHLSILQSLGHLHLLLQTIHDINTTEDGFSKDVLSPPQTTWISISSSCCPSYTYAWTLLFTSCLCAAFSSPSDCLFLMLSRLHFHLSSMQSRPLPWKAL